MENGIASLNLSKRQGGLLKMVNRERNDLLGFTL
jgi:hypothetical protein